MGRNRINGHRIALAGISAAISLGAVIASFYITQVSISLNILAAIGIMIPLSQEYYREAILAYVAVCLLGGIFANIHIIFFVLVGGAYTIFTIAVYNKKIKLHMSLVSIIKIGYACFVFYIMYGLTKTFFIDLEKLNIKMGLVGTPLYLLLNAVFVALFIGYDGILIIVYRSVIKIIERIFPSKSKNKGKDTKSNSPYLGNKDVNGTNPPYFGNKDFNDTSSPYQGYDLDNTDSQYQKRDMNNIDKAKGNNSSNEYNDDSSSKSNDDGSSKYIDDDSSDSSKNE